MTPEHLLPANASPLEQSLSLATDSLSRLAVPADAIRQFKVAPTDPLLPWLIWEYGLGELLPYLPEPRRAIAEGIRWQRLRGTPAALTTALSWIGATATVEQSGCRKAARFAGRDQGAALRWRRKSAHPAKGELGLSIGPQHAAVIGQQRIPQEAFIEAEAAQIPTVINPG